MAAKKSTSAGKSASARGASSGRGASSRGTGGRSTAGGRKSSAASKVARQRAAARAAAARARRRQTAALVTIAVAIMLFALLCISESGVLGNGIKTFFSGLFGICAFFIPFLLVYIAVLSVRDKQPVSMRAKVFQGIVLVCLICAAIHIFTQDYLDAGTLFSGATMSRYYHSGWHSGGVIGAIFGGLLLIAFRKVGAVIAVMLLILLFFLLVSSITLADCVAFFRKLFGRRDEEDDEDFLLEDLPQPEIAPEPESAPRRRRSKFNPDVSLGPEPESAPEALPLQAKQPEIFIPAPPIDVPAPAPLPGVQLDDLIDHVARTEGKKKPEEAPIPVDVPEEALDTPATADYILPPVTLLKNTTSAQTGGSEELRANAERLVETLRSFGVETRILNISRGPAVTRYELQPCAGVKISRITNLADDIALNLAASGVRIEAPIPNKSAVGIEVPNKSVQVVGLREVIDSPAFRSAESRLTVALGRDIAGNVAVADLSKMPHLLIAGSTGSGKSVCINSFIISLLYKATPDEVKLMMIDPKMVELGIYNGIPHLFIPVVTDPRKAAGALGWAVGEMTKRYNAFAENNVRDIRGYNALADKRDDLKRMPQIVIIIDELADLMMTAPNEIEESICRLAQMARAAGMHLVIATQRPSVDVITGIIKANVPSRLAFAVSSQVDSRTILDSGGAEKLLGRGDMLFHPMGTSKPMRIQGCFVSDAEVEAVIDFIKQAGTPSYDEKVLDEIDKLAVKEKSAAKAAEKETADASDAKLREAIECVIEAGMASTSLLQRRLSLGYARAARIMDEMESRGIIGPAEGSKPRKVLLTRKQWLEMNVSRDDAVGGADNADFADE